MAACVLATGLLVSSSHAKKRKDDNRGCQGAIEIAVPDAKNRLQVVPIAQFEQSQRVGVHYDKARRAARTDVLKCAYYSFIQSSAGKPESAKAYKAFKKKFPGVQQGQLATLCKTPKSWQKVGGRNAMTIEATYFQHFLHGYNTPKKRTVEVRLRSWGTNKNCVWDSKGKGYQVLGTLTTQPIKKAHEKSRASIRDGKIAGQKVTFQFPMRKYRKYNMSKKAEKSRMRIDVKAQVRTGKGAYKSSAFAPLGRGKKGPANELLRARKEKYVGCGRHAAQHLLDFQGHVLPMHVIGNHVKLHKMSMLATKLEQKINNGIRQKPVIPKDIRTGINNILSSNKESIRIFRSTKARKDNQKAIREHIKEKGPIIALVKNGAHYVTAMGHWQPLFDARPSLGSFYTFSNGKTTMYPHGEYSLKFNKTSAAIMKAVDNSYRPNTILYAVPK